MDKGKIPLNEVTLAWGTGANCLPMPNPFKPKSCIPGFYCGRRRQSHARRLAYPANYRLQLLG